MEGVQTMFAKFIDVIQTFLTEPAILIGILVGVGYALDKKTPIKIITGMISAMVGLMMVLFGGFQFSATFKTGCRGSQQSLWRAWILNGFIRHESRDANSAGR